MSIISRYVFWQAAGALVLILMSLSGVVWIALALKQLNLVTTQGQDALTFLTMTTLALPNLMALIAPIALLVAAMHTLSRMSGDSELIVLTAAGANIWVLARPLIALAMIVAVAVSMVNHFAMPWSLRLLRDYVIQVRTDLISQVLQPGRFSAPEPGITFHIRDRALNGELKGLLMHDTRDQKVPTSYLAETGTIVKQDNVTYLAMRNGHVLRRPDPKEPAQIIEFQSYVVDLDRFEAKTTHYELKPRERYYLELVAPSKNDPDAKRLAGQLRAELHERFANPFYSLAFVMIVVAFMGPAQSTRQNRWEATALAAILCVGARVGGLAANNLVVINAKWIGLMYAIPLGLVVMAAVMMHFGLSSRGQGRLSAGLSALVAGLQQLWPGGRRRTRSDGTAAVAGS